MRSDIYSHNRINLVASFFYTGLIQTFRAIRASGTVRRHMVPDVIRIGSDRKMSTIMTCLSTRLLSRGFAETSVLFLQQAS